MFDQYAEKVDETERLGLCVAACGGMFMGIIGLVATGCFAGIVFYGGILVLADHITSGTLTSFLLLAITIGASIGSMASLFGSLMSALGANERVFAILDKAPRIPLGLDDGRDGAIRAARQGDGQLSGGVDGADEGYSHGSLNGGAGSSTIGAGAMRLRVAAGSKGVGGSASGSGLESGELGLEVDKAFIDRTLAEPRLLYQPHIPFTGRV